MIRSYTLPSGKEINTITIPKGTLLFRGIHMETSRSPFAYLDDFFGTRDPVDDTYKVSQHTQMFFYPAPYISDSVEQYMVHMIYITQYDLELLLLIRPATDSRENAMAGDPHLDAMTACSELSAYDNCGFEMSRDDPCFTETARSILPDINGWIAIAATDASKFRMKLAQSMRAYNKAFLQDSLPFIVENSRGIQSVPEIAIHPMYRRDQNCLEFYRRVPYVYNSYYEKIRPNFAYYPLYAVSNQGVVPIDEFRHMKPDELDIFTNMNVKSDGVYAQRPLYQHMRAFITAALGCRAAAATAAAPLCATIDTRTGFYVATSAIPNSTSTKTTRVNIGNGVFIPFTYAANSKAYIRAHLTQNAKYLKDYFAQTPLSYERNLERFFGNLRAAGINGTPYVLHKGDNRKYVIQYKLDEIIGNARKDSGHTTRRRRRFATSGPHA